MTNYPIYRRSVLDPYRLSAGWTTIIPRRLGLFEDDLCQMILTDATLNREQVRRVADVAPYANGEAWLITLFDPNYNPRSINDA